ncbi:hypothetical protein SAMN04489859_102019 [Paracoccus alcaliphilus]|uniref:Uncharacterized protein n=1 Tax=Paracoccus alcaliphilus TaxID=34002 RepID=A0A1H8K2Q0_9RHOB|nr:hypothetical protein [Paracoccus alcaliphilus]WCR17516.1 hypothetical protein JHW40_14430 [Paracoccus alcaliphilus]SEN87204.1 hypothetical protein SAMN04489859_102019 [Paracoccus alcaliphilus]
MKIESIIRRPGGTNITLGATEYHFKPEGPDPRHVAIVADEAHARVLLSIAEGYRALDHIPAAPVTLDEARAALDEAFPGRPFDHLLNDGSVPQPVPQPEPQPEPEPEPEQSQIGAEPEPEGEDEDKQDDEPAGTLPDDEAALRAQFEELIGRKPHANMRIDTMKAQIEAAMAERQ